MKTPNAFFSARVLCVPFVLSVLFLAPLRAADTANPAADTAGKPDARAVAAAESVNWLGIELLKKNGAPGENALFSPYSIDMEIALAYASANGTTRPEIAQALHFPKAAEDCFGKLLHWTEQAGQTPADAGKEDGTGKQDAGGAKPAAPVEMLFANRIYVQAGLDLNANLLAQLKLNYDTAMVPVDFAKDPAAAAHGINDWISQQTMQHIPNLVPDGALDQTTNLVLANAIYLKAPWSKGFRADLTKPAPFHVGGDMTEVPMMRGYDVKLGLARHEGYTAIAIPYAGSKWQFLILLPDKSD
ncbi:MAG TPA: serpin family protein, partial [Chthoniobacteraceae bacterium]|nr:serpin family protein [Chthoniobacteraceae bacterium]